MGTHDPLVRYVGGWNPCHAGDCLVAVEFEIMSTAPRQGGGARLKLTYQALGRGQNCAAAQHAQSLAVMRCFARMHRRQLIGIVAVTASANMLIVGWFRGWNLWGEGI